MGFERLVGIETRMKLIQLLLPRLFVRGLFILLLEALLRRLLFKSLITPIIPL